MQPFIMITCSHFMSILYYVQSVMKNSVYPAHKCEDLNAAVKGNCSNETTVDMGYATPMT